MSNTTDQVIKEEKKILAEVKKEERAIRRLLRNAWVLAIIAVAVIVGIAGGAIYLKTSSNEIYTEKAEIAATTVDLGPTASGILEEVYVNRGDVVPANSVVARVGNELIKSKDGGIVSNVNDTIGKIVNPGSAVVTVINPDTLRIVGHIDEDKGLSDIRIGQHAVFTVDAFGRKQYEGIVDEISPSSRQGDIVFSISDKRETRVFDVKVRFDTSLYPELQNGMSAKLWIYKN